MDLPPAGTFPPAAGFSFSRREDSRLLAANDPLMCMVRRLLVTLIALALVCSTWAAPPADLPAVAALAQRLAALVPPANPDRAWRIDYPLALLQLKKARLAATAAEAGQEPAPLAASGQAALDKLQADQPIEPLPGQVTELAYVAANDGSVQPYYLYLPPGYSSHRAYPLITFLHGYVPTTTVLDPWVLTESECALAGDLGAMVLMPYGRRNTDFQGVGEKDVLDTLHETQALFSVDARRLYLTGVSMGGRGTWHIAAHHPGMFAAIAPISGHTDMIRWWAWDRATMPLWKLWLNQRDNPLDLAENLRNLPIFVQHGGADTLIPTEQSRLMVARLQALGIPVQYKEYAGQDHYIYWDPDIYRQAFQFLVKYRLNPSPTRVTLKAYSLDWADAFWLSTESFATWGQPGYADAQTSPDRASLTLQANNLQFLCLNLTQAPLVQQGQVSLLTGGVTRSAHAGVAGWSCNLINRPLPSPGWCAKRPGLCGPLDQAFTGPFLLVVGTGGGEQQASALRAQAEAWVDQWETFCDGRPPLLRDTEVTPSQIAGYNLILFGTPQTNSVLARLAGQLPLQIGDHRYQVGKRVYQGPTLGLALVYPNPLAPRRLVVVFAGEVWGRNLSPNHKFDELPDYVIYDTSAHEYDNTDQHLVAGLFDINWQLDESLQTRTSEGN